MGMTHWPPGFDVSENGVEPFAHVRGGKIGMWRVFGRGRHRVGL